MMYVNAPPIEYTTSKVFAHTTEGVALVKVSFIDLKGIIRARERERERER